MIASRLLSALRGRLLGLEVERVVIGLAYTGVVLSDGRCGLAATPHEGRGCAAYPRAGRLKGMPAWELAQGLVSSDPMAASLGLATVNAALGGDAGPSPDPLEALGVSEDDVVGMVGYIGPLAGPLEGKARKLLIFERDLFRAPGLLPDWAAELELPRCDVVFLSGTTFINKTVDRLLSLCRGRVGIIGPSTPMWPGLFEWGVDWLFGAKAPDPGRVLRVIAEGGGTRALYRNGLVKVALGRRSWLRIKGLGEAPSKHEP
ncbi:MAG: Uncharacterized protein XD60_1805 [Acetothermia bacterium 64_32]|nr:MAG: Uncharacterized protein XD60_1805 [Acetothermia bacterium 64_32]HAF71298.1 hypothetical protein [Candidatus Acetothermia bacterium]